MQKAIASPLSINKNVFLGFLSRAWSILLVLLLTPAYIEILGVEAFGIIGITLSIQIVIYMIDLGFGGAVVLETATHAAKQKHTELYHLFRTGEILYGGIAFVLFAFFLSCSDLIAYTWFSHVPTDQFPLKKIIFLIGGIVAGQWPAVFYSGALMGMQRQDLVNGINVVVATIKGVGSIVVLLFISPTLEAMLVTHVIGSLLQTISSAFCLWYNAKGGFFLGRFQAHILKRIGKKAFNLSLIIILTTFLFHVDKIILSHFLDLKAFGYYCFSWTFVNGLYNLCIVISAIFISRFSHHLALNQEKELIHTYHQGCQWVSLVIMPITLFIFFFSQEILLYWAKDPILVENTWLPAALLILGTSFCSLYSILQSFQIAHHWNGLTLGMLSGALLLFIPGLMVLTHYWGLIGAALAWPLLHLPYLFFYSHQMFKKMLSTEKKKWWIEDICLPTAAPLAVCMLAKWTLSDFLKGTLGMFLLGGVVCLAFLATAFASPLIRNRFLERRTNKI